MKHAGSKLPQPAGWLVVFLFAAGAALADTQPSSAKEWLMAMRQAMQNTNYEALVAYWKDRQVDTFRVLHGVQGENVLERLIALNGPRREVRRSRDQVTCVFPEAGKAVVVKRYEASSLLVNVPGKLDELEPHYEFRLGALERVAERMAQVVIIDARDAYRYDRRYWIAVDSRLPLKYELNDNDGTVLEQMVLLTLQTDKEFDQAHLAMGEDPAGKPMQITEHKPEPANRGEGSDIHFRAMPAGFHPMMDMYDVMGVDKKRVRHVLLSDGFSSVSVYVAEDFGPTSPMPAMRKGSVNSYTRQRDQTLITVLGDVPMRTVREIAYSVDIRRVHDD